MLASSNNSLPIEWLDEEVLEVKTCPFFLIYIYVYLCVCVCVCVCVSNYTYIYKLVLRKLQKHRQWV